MVLHIENLGIVNQANIDLSKKLILLCGRNSTGKTYVSYVLHAFFDEGNIYSLKCIDTIVEQLLRNGKVQIEKAYIEEWLAVNCQGVMVQMGSIFGIADSTRDKLFAKFALSAEFSNEDYHAALHSTINDQMGDGSSVWRIAKAAGSDIVTVETTATMSDLKKMGGMRATALVSNLLRHLAFCNTPSARMLTVERNSIYTFKTELSLSRNELIEQIQQAGKSEINVLDFINRSSRRYPLAVRSSLRVANDLETVQKSESPFAPVAGLIERDLLKGEVSMTKNGDVEFHAQGMAKSRKLPFHLSSSIVKTMASLVIYLRHIARVGDILIVDEPEMNFHPDVQVLLAQIFVMLMGKGLHVVVSTHSDYIIREMNNLIMAESINRRGETPFVEEMGYHQEVLLHYEDILVLYFKPVRKSTVVVNVLPVDEEGFSVDSIDQTIQDQNLKAERLYAQLISDN